MNDFDCAAFAFSQSLEELIQTFDRLEESFDAFDGSSTAQAILTKLFKKSSEHLGSLSLLSTVLEPYSARAKAFEEF